MWVGQHSEELNVRGMAVCTLAEWLLGMGVRRIQRERMHGGRKEES